MPRVRANLELLLNCSMRLRVRLRAALAGDVGVIEANDQRNLLQVRLSAAVAGGL